MIIAQWSEHWQLKPGEVSIVILIQLKVCSNLTPCSDCWLQYQCEVRAGKLVMCNDIRHVDVQRYYNPEAIIHQCKCRPSLTRAKTH